LVGSLTLSVTGVFMGFDRGLVGWLCAGLFGLMSIAFAATTVRPPRLTVDTAGFTIEVPWRRHRFEFVDCGEFRPLPSPILFSRGTVQFEWRPSDADRARRRDVQGLFGIGEVELAELLNRRRSAIVDC
jgi:hypothetical protein